MIRRDQCVVLGSFGLFRSQCLISSPSFSQFTTSSAFPNHLRNSPPLLYGNHFRPLFTAASKDSHLNPIRWSDTSNHFLTNRALSFVDIPWRGLATDPTEASFSK